MTILAYADRQSVRHGETIEFKISLIGGQRYTSQMVRLVGPYFGDSEHLPARFEKRLDSSINGTHRGERQATQIGSWIRLEKTPPIETVPGFTLAAFVWPTLPAASRRQNILGNFVETQSEGVALAISEGNLVLLAGGISEPVTIGPVERHRWYFVAASIDRTTRKVIGIRRRMQEFTVEEPATYFYDGIHQNLAAGDGRSFAIAAGLDGAGLPANHFNGKIERPRAIGRALDQAALQAMANAGPLAPIHPDALADWDFSQEIPSDRIIDLSQHACHGRTIQMPARAVAGLAWNGQGNDWRAEPSQYGAIHFHETDLADAGWQTSLSLAIPSEWKSACYALKLTADSTEWYVPFFVLPEPKEKRAGIALLLPTATYAAYANPLYRTTKPWHEATQGRLVTVDETDLLILRYPEIGRSTYDTHSDGSSVHYGSMRRPVVNFRPTGRPYKFAMDLFIVAWLEHLGIAFDVITDNELHHEGARLLGQYDAILTGSHPEYWTHAMLDGLADYLRSGGRFMCLGGNGLFWAADLHPELQGVVEVRRLFGQDYGTFGRADVRHSLSGTQAGMWAFIGRPQNYYIGVGGTLQGSDVCAGYRRNKDSCDPRVRFMFEGISDDVLGNFGLLTGGAAGYEIDRADFRAGTPPHALVVASSFDHSSNFESDLPEKVYLRGLATRSDAEPIRADVVFFETPNGGAVFSVGSIAYCASLSWNGYKNNLSKLTENLLRRFAAPEPFAYPVKRPSPDTRSA